MLRTFLAVLLSFWVALAGAQEFQPVPPLKARITDLTGTLSADERGKLETKLQAFEREKGSQIAVLIVPTTKPEAIEQYSIRVVEQWKLGRKGVDDGVLLLVAKEDRKLRIEVGYGLEGALNDATAKRIVSDVISPRFKEGKYFAGIDAGVAVMMSVIGGEQLPPPDQTPRRGNTGSSDSGGGFSDGWIVGGLILVFGVGGILRSLFGRFIGAGIVAAIAGVIAFFILSSLAIAGIVALLVFIFSLAAGSGGGWSGGSGGSFSSGGGGFSGGGGGFGGGGASGDW